MNEGDFLRKLIDLLPDNIYIKDTESRFVFGNEAVARRMGAADVRALIGKTDFDFYPTEQAQSFFADEQAIIKSGKSLSSREERVADQATGEEHWHLTIKVPLCDDTSKVIGIGGISRDITERKRFEQQIVRTNADLERHVQERTAALVNEIAERKRLQDTLSIERNLMRTLMDLMPDNIFAKDAKSRFILANQSVADVMGSAKPDSLIGKTDFDFYPNEQATKFFNDEQNVIKAGQPLIDREETAEDKTTGESRWLSTTKVPLRDENGNVIGIVGISRNITERKQAEESIRRLNSELEQRVELRTAELAKANAALHTEVAEREQLQSTLSAERNLLRILIDLMPDNIFAKDTSGRFILANRAVARDMGAGQPEELIGKTDFDFYPSEMAQGFFADEQQVMQTGKPLVGREERVADIANNAERWHLTIKVPLRDETGRVTGIVGISRDITERKHYEEQLKQHASYDQLTGLPNRRLLLDMLNQALSLAQRGDYALAVVFFDLDRFKSINDTFGHHAGDELLLIVAERLKAAVRKSDTVARLGGDEFVLLLPSQGRPEKTTADEKLELPSAILDVLTRILQSVAQPVTFAGKEVKISCSAGVSFFPQDGATRDVLLKNADRAMYAAKANGGNCIQLYTSVNEPLKTP